MSITGWVVAALTGDPDSEMFGGGVTVSTSVAKMEV